jgi:hypothetical protein
MTKLRIEGSGVWIPGVERDFYLFRKVQTVSGAHPASYLMDNWSSFPRIKRPRREFDHWSPSSPRVKNEWYYTSTSHLCLHCVDRKNWPYLLHARQWNDSRYLVVFLLWAFHPLSCSVATRYTVDHFGISRNVMCYKQPSSSMQYFFF